MNKMLISALGLGSGLLLSGCDASRPNDEAALTQGSLDLAIEQVIDNTLIPAVSTFASAATTFNSQLADFCAAPDASSLAATQTAWKNLANRWYQVLPFNFGPVNDDLVFPAYLYVDSYRLRGTSYIETVRTEVDNLLVSDDTLNADYFAGKTFQYVGLLALEVTLFETAGSQSADSNAVLAEFVEQPRKCEIASGLAGLMQQKADYIEDGWLQAYSGSSEPYRSLFLAGETDDGSTPMVTLITAVQEYLDYLDQRDTVSNVATLSGNAWAEVSASVDVVEDLLEGADTSTVSLFSLMEASGNSSAVNTVRSNIALAREAISDQDAVTFNSAAATIDGNFKREIPDSLDVSLGINFTDGD
jgi:predicted lipoprotein